MAAYDITLPGSPTLQPLRKVAEGEADVTLKQFFVQRAWNLNTQAWETWTTEDEPDPNPPSGDPITGLTTAGIWKQVT
ncbi:MAG: hypothetical protein DRJ03_27880 [Chloroflexi bacterium]|nr:MAG: hypothetical protein DRJ03_27880 [Chloroflexota bacterium]